MEYFSNYHQMTPAFFTLIARITSCFCHYHDKHTDKRNNDRFYTLLHNKASTVLFDPRYSSSILTYVWILCLYLQFGPVSRWPTLPLEKRGRILWLIERSYSRQLLSVISHFFLSFSECLFHFFQMFMDFLHVEGMSQ